MQKENNLTAGQWCDHWFTANRHKWNSNTEGGYRNLIYSHIIPSIGGVVLSGLTKQTIINFYDSLRSQGLGARSVWCVHLLLRRCMDEAAQDQLIPYNPVRLCQEPKAEEYKTAPLRLGQLQRYLNAAEQLGVLPLIYTGLVRSSTPSALFRQIRRSPLLLRKDTVMPFLLRASTLLRIRWEKLLGVSPSAPAGSIFSNSALAGALISGCRRSNSERRKRIRSVGCSVCSQSSDSSFQT